MTKSGYKEYFEQNNFKRNNYETAKFIQFLMREKTKGKEIEELTRIKHSQITSYKKIINSGKIEELKDKSISKVFKSIEKSPKKDEEIIFGIENLKLDDILSDRRGEDDDDCVSPRHEQHSEDDEDDASSRSGSWEDDLRKMQMEYENEYTEELELVIADLEAHNRELNNEIKKLKKKGNSDEVRELKSENERLRSENASLLAYKKFFEDMKLKMDSVASGT